MRRKLLKHDVKFQVFVKNIEEVIFSKQIGALILSPNIYFYENSAQHYLSVWEKYFKYGRGTIWFTKY